MADSVNTIEDYLKYANLKLDRVLFRLDSCLDQRAKEMEIPFEERCALDDINRIQDQLNELRARFQHIKTTRDELAQVYGDKIDELEKRMTNLL